MARAAAEHGAALIRDAVARRGHARIVAATAASQLEFLDCLSRAPDIPWELVELFHLDEYIGLPGTHPASFRRMLREQLIDRTGIVRHHLLDAERDALEVGRRVGDELISDVVDAAFIGIGENGHIAFNDPPADFITTTPYLEVALDEVSRRQQVREGWFATLDEVPRRALSMSVAQIMKAVEILVIVPDERKAVAVAAATEGRVTPLVPASILQRHPAATLYLDAAAASRLSSETRASYEQV